MRATGLPEAGFLALPSIIGNPHSDPPIPAIVPVSRSTWFSGVRTGRFPKPVKITERRVAWRVRDIRALLEKLEAEGDHA